MPLNGSRARRMSLALALTLLSALLVPAQTANDCTIRVTLLQVNDVYQFMPVDRGGHGGLARLSTLRQKVRQQSPNTIFLLAGDTISPSVESITYKGQQMIDAWNQIGLDYAVFGNHEFDFGPDVLRQRITESRFKWLGANVIDKKTGEPFAGTPLYVVHQVGGVKVGILGLVLPETKTTSSPGPDVEFRDVCETARRIVPRMREEGVRAIVALTHLSMNEDKALARCVEDIDVIIGGHEHTLLQSSSSGTPIFKMTADAREMGRIDLNINPQSGEVQSIDWQILRVDNSVAEDPQFAAVTTKYRAKLTELSRRVGATSVDLDARSEPNRTEETNIADFVADAFRRTTGADVALVNGGSIRADTIITSGELTMRDVLSILPFSNDLVKIEVTGATILAALENGVSRTAPGAEPGRFPQVSGLRFSFDATRPAGSRTSDVTIGGQPVNPQKTYTLVTTKYVAEGGDGYEMFKGARNVLTEKLIDSEVLRRAIAAAKTIAPRTDGRIRRLDKADAEEPCPPKAATAK